MTESVTHTFEPSSPGKPYGYHIFKQGACEVTLGEINEVDGSASIDGFYCNLRGSGFGRKLLLYVLNWIKTTYENVDTILLTAVPSVKYEIGNNYTKKQKLALEKLKTYYTNLGFIEISDEDDFEGIIDTIIENINDYPQKGGFTSKYKKNNKRTKHSKRVKSLLYKTKRKSY